MSTTLTIDLETLDSETAKRIAGFILAFTDTSEYEDSPEATRTVKVYSDIKQVVQDFGPSDPATMFGIAAAPPPPVISDRGPVLEFPNPPQAVAVAPTPTA